MNKRMLEPTHVRIPVQTAIERTTNWRNFIDEVFSGVPPNTIAKAIYISKKDIEDLFNYCQSEAVCGVRAYFTLKNDYKEHPNDNNIRFVMVPVLYDHPKYPNGRDYLHSLPAANETLDSTDVILDTSNVFDFTVPCPDCCDTSSPLYSSQS